LISAFSAHLVIAMSQPSSSRPALPPSRELGKESAGDKLYGWDDEKYQAAMAAKPWQKEYDFLSVVLVGDS